MREEDDEPVRDGHPGPVSDEWVPARPHPALRPFIASAVGYRYGGSASGVHRGLPSPSLTFVVTLDEPLVLAAHPDPQQAPGRYDALLGGLHTRPALITQTGWQAGVQLALSPLGARALLGLPAGALASLDCPVADVLGTDGAELIDRVRSAPDWAGRFAALEHVLLRRLQADSVPAPEVVEAWRLTLASGGRLRVADVAGRVGWSERHLLTRFRAETGLTPKEAARVVRFDRARRALAARVAGGGPPDLAALAVATGYADQAHLTREWRAFSGLPPTRWLAAEFGIVQDGRTPVSTP
ncbi:helix-turn-helix domain-containing protein [Modestobacter sp. VKM Ac-2984]|uniref:helix-turn-helix domain-containing protein n=1 Tax=Modestobacter sp. VKM Ac-2984 TaxID=3004138 RepID=UPI0022AA4064|nr:AraC family transcriptional regulator [Modestobacter sp. VKM Ac-2984]MCZ2815487.1 AraC family transcriptional regulator [Modestobacter sp. VKM Ac-2984]